MIGYPLLLSLLALSPLVATFEYSQFVDEDNTDLLENDFMAQTPFGGVFEPIIPVFQAAKPALQIPVQKSTNNNEHPVPPLYQLSPLTTKASTIARTSQWAVRKAVTHAPHAGEKRGSVNKGPQPAPVQVFNGNTTLVIPHDEPVKTEPTISTDSLQKVATVNNNAREVANLNPFESPIQQLQPTQPVQKVQPGHDGRTRIRRKLPINPPMGFKPGQPKSNQPKQPTHNHHNRHQNKQKLTNEKPFYTKPTKKAKKPTDQHLEKETRSQRFFRKAHKTWKW